MTIHEALTSAAHHPYRLRIADFLLLDEAGRFDGRGKTELLDGEIYVMNAQHRPHARIKMAVYDALRDALAGGGTGLTVMVEASVELSEHDAPEPDLTLTSDPLGSGLIPLSSVALVVEVADATLRTDLGIKAKRYAAANVPEYWVVDIDGRAIRQLWKAIDGVFTEQHDVAFGQPLTAQTIAGLTIASDRF